MRVPVMTISSSSVRLAQAKGLAQSSPAWAAPARATPVAKTAGKKALLVMAFLWALVKKMAEFFSYLFGGSCCDICGHGEKIRRTPIIGTRLKSARIGYIVDVGTITDFSNFLAGQWRCCGFIVVAAGIGVKQFFCGFFAIQAPVSRQFCSAQVGPLIDDICIVRSRLTRAQKQKGTQDIQVDFHGVSIGPGLFAAFTCIKPPPAKKIHSNSQLKRLRKMQSWNAR